MGEMLKHKTRDISVAKLSQEPITNHSLCSRKLTISQVDESSYGEVERCNLDLTNKEGGCNAKLINE